MKSFLQMKGVQLPANTVHLLGTLKITNVISLYSTLIMKQYKTNGYVILAIT